MVADLVVHLRGSVPQGHQTCFELNTHQFNSSKGECGI